MNAFFPSSQRTVVYSKRRERSQQRGGLGQEGELRKLKTLRQEVPIRGEKMVLGAAVPVVPLKEGSPAPKLIFQSGSFRNGRKESPWGAFPGPVIDGAVLLFLQTGRRTVEGNAARRDKKKIPKKGGGKEGVEKWGRGETEWIGSGLDKS